MVSSGSSRVDQSAGAVGKAALIAASARAGSTLGFCCAYVAVAPIDPSPTATAMKVVRMAFLTA